MPELNPDQSLERLSLPRIFAVASSFFSVVFAWGVEFALLTPQLSELGVPEALVPVVWLAGPLSGFIVQPIAGVYSDECHSKMGRRRPFIIGGVIVTCVGMLILAFSCSLGRAISPSNYTTRCLAAIIFTVIGLYIMNFSLNVIQGPARALVGDVVPKIQQQYGNAITALMMGLGQLLSNLACSTNLVGIIGIFPSNFFAVFVVGITFVLLGIIPSLTTKEVPLESTQPDDKRVTVKQKFLHIWLAAKSMPRSLFKINVIFFFSWMAFFPFMIYITDFFGRDVYHGDPNADHHSKAYHDYERGVREGALGLCLMSVVTLIFGPFQARLLRMVGLRLFWCLSQLSAAICFTLPLFFRSRNAALAYTAAAGINFVTFQSVPFALVKGCIKDDLGVQFGVMNGFAVVAQTITTFLGGSLLIPLCHTTAAALAAGGFFGYISAALVFIIRPKDYKLEGDSSDEQEDLSEEETAPLLQIQ